jgi:LysM repeat protein
MLWRKKVIAALCLVLGLVLCGCNPPGQGAADEEKEPQFLIGRSRVNAMNYSGAIEAFEMALEKNPQSAAAHFELGWLYAEKEADAAAAIHHYQKFLKLRPNSDRAETVKQHIFRLKQELARGVLPVPASSELQKQVEQFADDNRRLNDELAQLKARLAMIPTNRPNNFVASSRTNGTQQASSTRPGSAVQSSTTTSQTANSTTTARQHRIQSGETLASVARRYDVRLESLMSANPSVNPRRLQPGQSLVIPRR